MKLRTEKMTNKTDIQKIRINKTNSEENNPLKKEKYNGNGANKGLNLSYKLKGPKKSKRILKEILFILYQLIKYLAFSFLFVKSHQKPRPRNFFYVILKTQGTGWINIFDGSFRILPNRIYINDIDPDEISYRYYFDDSENSTHTFKLVWYNKINSTRNMFYMCDKIIEIDFLNFDTSQVTDMGMMFACCSSLISLNISNFNTTLVTNMAYMFNSCLLLKSLNLSHFNTSKVTNMHRMFESGSSLRVLDLSNFNVSQVTDMGDMFCRCSSLTSLNLLNFYSPKCQYMEVCFLHANH